MIDVETSIEPPGLDEPDEPHLGVYCVLSEADDTHRAGFVLLPVTATDARIADALIASLRGCAAMRSPGLVAAVERRLR